MRNDKRFSRRHQTSQAHQEAVEQHREHQAEKVRTAKERQHEAAQRNPEDQIKRLNRILGDGKGAKKERMKLLDRMSEQIGTKTALKKNFKKKRVKAIPELLPWVELEDKLVSLMHDSGNLEFVQGEL